MSGNARPGFARLMMKTLAGPLIWFAHFSFLYGATSFGRYVGLDETEVSTLLWVATGAAALGTGMVVWMAPRGSITSGLAFLSLVAIVFEALVLWIIPR